MTFHYFPLISIPGALLQLNDLLAQAFLQSGEEHLINGASLGAQREGHGQEAVHLLILLQDVIVLVGPGVQVLDGRKWALKDTLGG